MNTTTYFLRHGIKRYNKIPGRYPYDVTGSALHRNGATFTRQTFTGCIYGDGYDDGPASNMDPHVLSDIIPWFLSFCLIDKDDEKRRVAPEKKHILPKDAKPDDLIVFGGYVNDNVIFVDTVLCVDRLLPIPQEDRNLKIKKYHEKYWRLLNLPEQWSDFQETRAYVYNLRDAEPPNGHHQTTNGLDPYLQIVGRRLKTDEIATIQRDALFSRLLEKGGFNKKGGFNFIPLRAYYESENREIISRRPLFTTKIPKLGSLIKQNSVTKLDPDTSRDLLSAILHQADTLVLDPIDPAKPLPSPARSGH